MQVTKQHIESSSAMYCVVCVRWMLWCENVPSASTSWPTPEKYLATSSWSSGLSALPVVPAAPWSCHRMSSCQRSKSISRAWASRSRRDSTRRSVSNTMLRTAKGKDGGGALSPWTVKSLCSLLLLLEALQEERLTFRFSARNVLYYTTSCRSPDFLLFICCDCLWFFRSRDNDSYTPVLPWKWGRAIHTNLLISQNNKTQFPDILSGENVFFLAQDNKVIITLFVDFRASCWLLIWLSQVLNF